MAILDNSRKIEDLPDRARLLIILVFQLLNYLLADIHNLEKAL